MSKELRDMIDEFIEQHGGDAASADEHTTKPVFTRLMALVTLAEQINDSLSTSTPKMLDVIEQSYDVFENALRTVVHNKFGVHDITQTEPDACGLTRDQRIVALLGAVTMFIDRLADEFVNADIRMRHTTPSGEVLFELHQAPDFCMLFGTMAAEHSVRIHKHMAKSDAEQEAVTRMMLKALGISDENIDAFVKETTERVAAARSNKISEDEYERMRDEACTRFAHKMAADLMQRSKERVETATKADDTGDTGDESNGEG